MNYYDFGIGKAALQALGSGALFWPEERLLCVSDLHLGRSERLARRGGTLLPPYETRETLTRLAADLERTGAATVVCLGDSFDDLAAADGLDGADAEWLMRLTAGRRWVWIAGNHDPGPPAFGGSHRASLTCGPLAFRHVADPAATGEVSGHYHPKLARRLGGRRLSRACFLIDRDRAILPAYGAYTGGLGCDAAPLSDLMRPDAVAVPTGATPRPVPAAAPAGKPRMGPVGGAP